MPDFTLFKMQLLVSVVLLSLALVGNVQAQFGFFDQMFGGGHQQQQQQPQDVPSDSGPYRANYERCTSLARGPPTLQTWRC